MKNYYSLLGIDNSATKADIKKNYRLLATKFHPDKNPDPAAASKFIEITEAYNVLSDRKARARYDLSRWEEMKRAREKAESFNTETYVDTSFTVVIPPAVSLRTRRNRAQQKRGAVYQAGAIGFQKIVQLVIEGLRIVSRYVLHIMGFILFSVILYSVSGQVKEFFEKGGLSGIGTCVIMLSLVYVLSKIARSAVMDFKKDIRAFSVFYNLSLGKAAVICIVMFVVCLLVLLSVLKFS